MTPEDARRLILDAITEVAPEADVDRIDVEQPLQEQLDLDSMDFLAILSTIGEQTGLELPEADYPRLAALGPAVDYLVAATDGGN
jgi:acyl carrier protein